MKAQDFDGWVAELRKYQHVEVNHLGHSLSRDDLFDEDDSDNEMVVVGREGASAKLEKAKKDLEQLQILAKPYLPDKLLSPSISNLDISGTGKHSVRVKTKKKTTIGNSFIAFLDFDTKQRPSSRNNESQREPNWPR